MEGFFDFEKPIAQLERKLQDLRELAKQEGVDLRKEINLLEKRVVSLIEDVYSNLTPWQRVQTSRHPNRPYTRDYIDALFPSFLELQGDRLFSDDQAIIGGTAHLPTANSTPATTPTTMPIMIIGHQKGRTTKQKIERNFGMARPEGYRKAMRLMRLAERSRLPILTFIDTPGAFPGPDAEERGQAQAIAESIQLMFGLTVPILAVVIGEGGSGGALAIGVADKVLIQEFGTYSVISPESCASILWSDSTLAERASERLKLSPSDLLRLGAVDAIVPEPNGGAHRNWPEAFKLMQESIIKHFNPIITTSKKAPKKLITDRAAKFRKMGNLALAHAPSDISELGVMETDKK